MTKVASDHLLQLGAGQRIDVDAAALRTSSSNAGSRIVCIESLAQRATVRVRQTGRRQQRGAERGAAGEQREDLPLRVVLAEIDDRRHVRQLAMALARVLHDEIDLLVAQPVGAADLDARPRLDDAPRPRRARARAAPRSAPAKPVTTLNFVPISSFISRGITTDDEVGPVPATITSRRLASSMLLKPEAARCARPRRWN